MNLKEVIADGAYTIFARMGDDSRLKMMESINYIKQLSQLMEANIDDWDITAIFGTGRGNTLYVDRREINKRFMEKLATVPAPVTNQQVDPALANVSANMNRAIKSSLIARISDMERQRANQLRSAQDYMIEGNNRLAEAAQTTCSILSLRKEEIDFAGQIKEVIDGGFWKFVRLDGDRMVFHTVNELNLRYVKKSANIDLTVNLGKYACNYSPVNGRLEVVGIENNLNIDGVIHPHVANGVICWGGAASTISAHLSALNIAAAMQLLANLLSDYNDGNPYRRIDEFYAQRVYTKATELRLAGGNLGDVRIIFSNANVEDYYDYWARNIDPKRRNQ